MASVKLSATYKRAKLSSPLEARTLQPRIVDTTSTLRHLRPSCSCQATKLLLSTESGAYFDGFAAALREAFSARRASEPATRRKASVMSVSAVVLVIAVTPYTHRLPRM